MKFFLTAITAAFVVTAFLFYFVDDINKLKFNDDDDMRFGWKR